MVDICLLVRDAMALSMYDLRPLLGSSTDTARTDMVTWLRERRRKQQRRLSKLRRSQLGRRRRLAGRSEGVVWTAPAEIYRGCA